MTIPLPRARIALWLLLALPGFWILARWSAAPDLYGYGNVIGDTGRLSAWLVMATLAVTPIRLIFRRGSGSVWLMRHRRDLGVASFAYAAGHTIIYLVRKAQLTIVWDELSTPYILVGWLSLAMFAPLAVTSNDWSVRWLKRSWKPLHRLVYPATILMFLHWVLLSFDPITAYAHIGIIAVIEIVRIALQRRQRVT